jgi:hypothetical protein
MLLPTPTRYAGHVRDRTSRALGEDIVQIEHASPHTTKSPPQLEEFEAALQHHLANRSCMWNEQQSYD